MANAIISSIVKQRRIASSPSLRQQQQLDHSLLSDLVLFKNQISARVRNEPIKNASKRVLLVVYFWSGTWYELEIRSAASPDTPGLNFVPRQGTLRFLISRL